MDSTATPALSAATSRSLDRHIERALRQRFGAGTSLRLAVRQVAMEMAAAGASREATRALLTRSVQEHPERHAWDRVSIVTGERASAVLTRQILDWADRPSATAEPPILDRSHARTSLRGPVRDG